MKPAIGMSVPGASSLGLSSPQAPELETDEEKRKRLLKAQQERSLPSLSSGVSDMGLGLTGYSAAGGIGGV